MKTSRLYHQLHSLLGQPIGWADQRHLQTLIWMVIGLVWSECISKREMEGLCTDSCGLCSKSSTAIQSVVAQSPYQRAQAVQSADSKRPLWVGSISHHAD